MKQTRAADVVQQVHETVQGMLAEFLIKPSERINEVALAERLGVSRTPLREALNRLATDGLVGLVPNRGFYARSLDPDEVKNLFELRSGVESVAVRAVCRRAKDEGIERLASEWNDVVSRSSVIEPRELAMADESFHEHLVALAENPELDKVMRNINVRIRFIRQCAIEHTKRRKDTISEHITLIDCIRSRNEMAAISTIDNHVSITADDAIDYIKMGLAKIYLRKSYQI